MTNVAIIPARGGSKGIPNKNLQHVGGRPLVVRAIEACRRVQSIDYVVVSTDSAEIADAAREAGANVLTRPADLSGDDATSESALLHVCENFWTVGPDDLIVFVQATSPFIQSSDVAAAIQRVTDGIADVIFSGTRSHGFLWSEDPVKQSLSGINHSPDTRTRRQDRPLEYLETGGFYVMSAPGFVANGHRFFGRLAVQEVSRISALEVDHPEDLALARALDASFARRLDAPDLSSVHALAMDFDGVHTDDRVILDQNGLEAALVSRSDGMGLSHLSQLGIPMVILSKERIPIVERRGEKLGIPVIHGIDDKLVHLKRWASDHSISLANVAYVGNDVNDLSCLGAVGWPIAVADAHQSVRQAARLRLTERGGRGALRELAEAILNSYHDGAHPSDRTQRG